MLPSNRPSGDESHTALESNPADATTITSSTTNDDSDVLPLHETQGRIQTQDYSPLFRLSPELRNIIYKYVFDGRDDECGWDEDHGCPKIDLVNASRCAPSNGLLRTCRRINSESRAFFVESERKFWSNTTFTLTFKENKSLRLDYGPAAFPSLLCNENISRIARITIDLVVTVADKPKFLNIGVKPTGTKNSESWNVSRTENYKGHYSEKLDTLNWLLPWKQSYHSECQPLLTYQQVRARIRLFTFDRPYIDFDFDIRGRHNCIVCGGNVETQVSSNRRADLMAVVAWVCEEFNVRL